MIDRRLRTMLAIHTKNTISLPMKKLTGAFALLAVVVLLASSCKTREKCPAYGQTEKVRQHKA